MTTFLLLLALLATDTPATGTKATAAPATLQMSIDLAQPDRAGSVRVQIESLADGVITASEQPLSALDRLERQTLAAGRYEITIHAAHHRSVTRRITASAGETVNLGVVGLPALPLVRGRVTGSDGRPLAAARVALPGNGARVPVDAKGAFAIEFDTARPDHLIVSAPHHGTRAIAVPSGSTDLLLPDVALGAPSTLTVSIERPDGHDHPLEVLLGELAPQKTPRWLDAHKLAAKETTTTFADVASGAYTLLVRGHEPLEQFATTVVLGANDAVRKKVAIEASSVEARVLLGDQPLPKARLRLSHAEHGYRTTIDTDANGVWRGESWQRGAWIARVNAPSVPTPVTLRTTLGEKSWVVKLPAIAVRGRVIDATTNEPIANAAVSLESESEESSSTLPTKTRADGRFEYRSVPPGAQTLHVRMAGYLYPAATSFALTADGSSKDVVVRLDRGVRKELAVVDSHAAPVARASVIAAIDDRVVSTSFTSEEGRATVSLPRADAVLYVVPLNAPFAVLRVAASNSDARLRVTLPRG
ncbi:MAG TPA: carboxypeptidase regulatory-like domain-containing protein, partial [Thermoanaerobaculia bacterium]